MTRPTPRNVLQVVRRRPDDRVRLQRVVRVDGGHLIYEDTDWAPADTLLRRGYVKRNAPWVRHPAAVGADVVDVADFVSGALQRKFGVLTLVGGEVTSITVDEAELRPERLVPLLHPVLGDGTDVTAPWDDATAERWDDLADLLPHVLPGATWVPVHAEVNGRPLAVVDLPSTGNGTGSSGLSAVLVDEDEEALVPLEDVASFSSYSEGGVTSWVVGLDLELIGRGALRLQGKHDDDTPPSLLAWPDEPEARAAVLARWVDAQQLDVLAALALEPLDPRHVLSDDDREEWDELLSGCGAHLGVSVGAPTTDLLRELLETTSAAYRATRLALADPSGAAGQGLKARLEAAADGSPTELLFG